MRDRVQKQIIKNNKGITLIALVVTVIVLLIITSITIGALTGQDGTINKSKTAKEKNEMRAERQVVEEATTIVINEDKYGNVTKETLEGKIDTYTGEGKTKVEEIEGANLIKVTFLDSNRSYYVDTESGEISEIQTEISDLTITCVPASELTNGDVTVKIEAAQKYIDDNYDIWYKTTREDYWKKYTSEIIITKNQTIFAKLQKSDKVSAVATTAITNIDKLQPNDFVPQITPTTRSIKIVANTIDCPETSEYACSGLAGYRFSKDNGSSWTSWQTSGTYTFDGLTQTTKYNLKIEAKDAVGNVRTVSTSATTKTVTALVKDANVTFSANPDSWTNQNVTVTASTTVSGFTLQTSINGTNWSNTGTQTRSTNGLVYARLWDGVNAGSHATCNITNIDKTAPTISSYTSNSPRAIVTLSGTAQDTGSGICAYMFSQDGNLNASSSGWQGITATTSSKTLTQNVTTGGTWYFYVKDQAGNYNKSSISIQVQTTWNYEYTGGVQSWTAPYSGWFKLEVWGAQGGNSTLNGSTATGGYGGYAYGNKYISQGSTIYITIGGMGGSANNGDGSGVGGGYNGGGRSGWFHDSRWGGGGGATSITTTNKGVLSNFNSYRSEIIIVAGGGGGAGRWSGNHNNGGAGGGANGSNGSGSYSGDGGTQSSGGSGWHYPNNPADKYVSSSFGQGQNSSDGSGGGGGYFGGGTGIGYGSAAGGGSGYTGGVSSAGMSNGARSGNGYARITWVSN